MSEDKRKDGQPEDQAGKRPNETNRKPETVDPNKSGSKTGGSGRNKPKTSTQRAPDHGENRQAERAQAADQSTATAGTTASAASAAQRPTSGADTSRTAREPAGVTSGGGGNAAGSGGRGAAARGGNRCSRGAVVVAVVALIVALLAIAISAWLWVNGQSNTRNLAARVATVEQDVQTNQSNVNNAVVPKLSSLQQRLQTLAGDQQDRQQEISQLQKQLKSVQTQNMRLAERFDGSRQRWDLRRIESLLIAANQRLQLYHDPQGARKALNLANQEIARLGDPSLFDIRSKIADEIAALQALPHPDIAGMSLTLAAQIKHVPELPLASDVPSEYHHDQGNGQGGSNNGESGAQGLKIRFTQGWDQFWGSVGNALSQLVTVRRGDGTQPALMPPNQAFFLSQNLRLQLRTAQLALLERNTQSYQDSLDTAQKWLQTYYDTGDSRVSGMLDQLGRIANVKLNWQAPDISDSLVALRRLIDQRAAAAEQRITGSGKTEKAAGSQQSGTPKAGAATGKQGAGKSAQGAKKQASDAQTGSDQQSAPAQSQDDGASGASHGNEGSQ